MELSLFLSFIDNIIRVRTVLCYIANGGNLRYSSFSHIDTLCIFEYRNTDRQKRDFSNFPLSLLWVLMTGHTCIRKCRWMVSSELDIVPIITHRDEIELLLHRTQILWLYFWLIGPASLTNKSKGCFNSVFKYSRKLLREKKIGNQ